MHPVCLLARHYDARQLMINYPPDFTNRYKQMVYEHVCKNSCSHGGQLYFSRWQAHALPKTLDAAARKTDVILRADSFQYEPVQQPGLFEWHLNFANWDLFSDYDGPLLAQDEHQVLEHPALGSLREALLAERVPFSTNGSDGPTPVLVRNVERSCIVDTSPNAAAGRPDGLYGYRFAIADPETVLRAVTRLNLPTISNILAIEAPSYGEGTYHAEMLRLILQTAYSGFAAARYDAVTHAGAQTVAIHTGFWGCGAYGGNRVVMSLLQMVAATMAGIDKLVFHTVDRSGMESALQAEACLRATIGNRNSISLNDLIKAIQSYGFAWGESDGN